MADIFLGHIPPRGISFKVPGAMHHARFMAKAIYSLKMFLFRDQLLLTTKELTALRQTCIFIIKFYIKVWYSAPLSVTAPNTDFELLKNLIKFEIVNKPVAQAARKKLSGHLWYISEELVALALFDESISIDVKEKMVKAMTDRPSVRGDANRLVIKEKEIESLITKDVSQFVSRKSANLFTQLEVSSDFLHIPPHEWPGNKNFEDARTVVKNLKVVNDMAERGVALMEEFNQRFTTDEEQMQFVLQTVQAHRKKYPDCTKKLLSSRSEGN